MGKKKADKAQAPSAGVEDKAGKTEKLSGPFKQLDTDPLALLVAPQDKATFFEKHWEKGPCVIKGKGTQRRSFFEGLLTLKTMLARLREREEEEEEVLTFGRDVNAARYVKGERETVVEEVADADTLETLHNKKGCTLQVVQPQRWEDKCWRLVAAMEAQLGCLVGLNAYLTPKGTQGLAPHHDEVELWVVQTGGSKAWKLYSPLKGFALPNTASGDLKQEAIGKPIMEVVLEPGDVLYLPRGTIHQAVAQKDGDSSHLTISTYMRHSWGDVASHMIQVAVNNVTANSVPVLPLSLRQSPPAGFLFQHSLLLQQDKGKKGRVGGKAMAEALRLLATQVEAEEGAGKADGLLSGGGHSLAMEFMNGRLPPHPDQVDVGKDTEGKPPGLKDRVKCAVRPGCLYLLPYRGPRSKGESMVKLLHCLENPRELHMIEREGDEEDEEGEEMDDEMIKMMMQEGDDESDDESEEEDGKKGKGGAKRKGDGKGAPQAKKQRGIALAVKKDESEDEEEEEEEEEFQDVCRPCTDGDEEEDDEDEEGEEEEEYPMDTLAGLVMPADHVAALAKLLGFEGEAQAVKISDLPLPTDEDKLALAEALWEDGIISVV